MRHINSLSIWYHHGMPIPLTSSHRIPLFLKLDTCLLLSNRVGWYYIWDFCDYCVTWPVIISILQLLIDTIFDSSFLKMTRLVLVLRSVIVFFNYIYYNYWIILVRQYFVISIISADRNSCDMIIAMEYIQLFLIPTYSYYTHDLF